MRVSMLISEGVKCEKVHWAAAASLQIPAIPRLASCYPCNVAQAPLKKFPLHLETSTFCLSKPTCALCSQNDATTISLPLKHWHRYLLHTSNPENPTRGKWEEIHKKGVE